MSSLTYLGKCPAGSVLNRKGDMYVVSVCQSNSLINFAPVILTRLRFNICPPELIAQPCDTELLEIGDSLGVYIFIDCKTIGTLTGGLCLAYGWGRMTTGARNCGRSSLLTWEARNCGRSSLLTWEARNCGRSSLLTWEAGNCDRGSLLTWEAGNCDRGSLLTWEAGNCGRSSLLTVGFEAIIEGSIRRSKYYRASNHDSKNNANETNKASNPTHRLL